MNNGKYAYIDQSGTCVEFFHDPNLSMNPREPPVEVSSGVLTSDSRFLGSAHALLAPTGSPSPPANSDFIQDLQPYRVSFDGRAPVLRFSPLGASGPAHMDWNEFGDFVDDSGVFLARNWAWTAIPAEDDVGFANATQENPLLAHRLFSLGMGEWAEPGADAAETRKRLRAGWPFELDADNCSTYVECVERQGLLEYRPQLAVPD